MRHVGAKSIQMISSFIKKNPEAGFRTFKQSYPKFRFSDNTFQNWKKKIQQEALPAEKPKRSYVRRASAINVPKEWLTAEDRALIERVKDLPESERNVCYAAIAKAAYLLNDVKNKVTSYDFAKSFS